MAEALHGGDAVTLVTREIQLAIQAIPYMAGGGSCRRHLFHDCCINGRDLLYVLACAQGMDAESAAALGQSSNAMHDDKEGVISSRTVRKRGGGPQ